jgi:[ribosomal protein S18]-alanine N-acetyltransferase
VTPLEIRPATTADVDLIAALQAIVPEAAQWPAADYLKHDCSVAVLDGGVVGFLVWRAVADEREILNLAVHPGSRRRGVACALLAAVLQEAPGRWFLEVRESNTAARQLYRKLGFMEVSTRPAYYEEPREPAIVMRFLS